MSTDLLAQYVGCTFYIKLQSFNVFGGGVQDISTCVAYTYTPTGVAIDHPVAQAILVSGGSWDFGLVTQPVGVADDFGAPFTRWVQAQIYNGTGGSITPTLTVKHAGTQDVWSSPTTDVNAASLQTCPASAWTQVAYTFTASASSYNGVEVGFDFGNNLGAGTKSIQLTELDIRVTPGVAAGLNSNPSPPELRLVAGELAFSQRYFYAVTNVYFGFTQNASQQTGNFTFPVTMRVAPNINNPSYSVTASNAGTVGEIATTAYNVLFHNSASNWSTSVGAAAVAIIAQFSAEL